MKLSKLNESFTLIEGNQSELKELKEFFKVERDGAMFDPMVKRGFKSRYDYFTYPHQNGLLIMNGLVHMIPGEQKQIEPSGFNDNEINDFIDYYNNKLPFKLYEYQEKAIKQILKQQKSFNKCATGSGKSVIISGIIEFFRLKGLKGILLVPNINLLTQFNSDIESYNLNEIYNNTEIIGGDNSVKNVKELNKTLTISTWQSLNNFGGSFDGVDYVICDEAHLFA